MSIHADLRIVPLAPEVHDRTGFSCGVASFDAYLKEQAGQDVRRKTNAVFVLVSEDKPTQILGYFTLSATAIAQGEVPEQARKYIPRYPLVSATLIGRLAVAKEKQGRGFGHVLLAHALRKAYESAGSVGSCMVVVDAIDEEVAGFYGAYGFVRLQDSMRLILPMRTIAKGITSS